MENLPQEQIFKNKTDKVSSLINDVKIMLGNNIDSFDTINDKILEIEKSLSSLNNYVKSEISNSKYLEDYIKQEESKALDFEYYKLKINIKNHYARIFHNSNN